MKPSVILYAVFLTVSLGIKAQQADTVSYEVTKNMPVFYEQLKQQLTYPAAWGKSTTKDFGKWRIETRNVVMECMQNLPPAPAKYDMSVVGTEQRAGYEARKIWFNVSEWSRIPAYLLVPGRKRAFSGCDNAARSWSTLFHRQRENGTSFRGLTGNIG